MDMSDVWKIYDREISETPMPSIYLQSCIWIWYQHAFPGEYQNMACAVQCRDCLKEGLGKFHILGMKDPQVLFPPFYIELWLFQEWSVRTVAATTQQEWRARCWGGVEAEALLSPRTWSLTPRRRTTRMTCPLPGLACAMATLASDPTGKAADATGCPPTFAEALS